jgi:hypothetical protein
LFVVGRGMDGSRLDLDVFHFVGDLSNSFFLSTSVAIFSFHDFSVASISATSGSLAITIAVSLYAITTITTISSVTTIVVAFSAFVVGMLVTAAVVVTVVATFIS